MQAAKDVSDQKIAVDVFMVTNDYGATLYGIRWAAVESVQSLAAFGPPDDMPL
jgi:hypothetical protein